jgi:tetratricopeptide (TPR) repeat protein
MRALSSLLFVGLCALACADVPPAPPKVGKAPALQSSGAWRPLPNSEGWRRFRTDHFELMTDLPEPLALEASVALERTRTALLQALWSQLAPSGQTERVRVVVLSEVPEFVHYFGNRVSGMLAKVNRPLMVLRGSPKHWERLYRGGKFSTSILRHELAHELAAGIYGRQPRWFAEGLAQFLEAVVVEGDSDIALVGRPNPVAFAYYLSYRSVGVKDALAWSFDPRQPAAQVRGLYGLSWMLVHWMYNVQQDLFVAYQEALMRSVAPEQAWADTFGAAQLQDLDEQLAAYAKSGLSQVDRITLPSSVVHPVPLPITAADVHALRAQLSLVGRGMDRRRDDLQDEAQHEFSTALALEPGHPEALRLWRSFHGMSKEKVLERLSDQVRNRPDDGEAWLFFGALLDGDEREAALRKAIALLGDEARAYNELAWYLVENGRAEEALPMAARAAGLAPRDAAVLDTYAASLFSVGRCPEALQVQLRAIDKLPEDGRHSPEWMSHFPEVLARYRAACGASGAIP